MGREAQDDEMKNRAAKVAAFNECVSSTTTQHVCCYMLPFLKGIHFISYFSFFITMIFIDKERLNNDIIYLCTYIPIHTKTAHILFSLQQHNVPWAVNRGKMIALKLFNLQ